MSIGHGYGLALIGIFTVACLSVMFTCFNALLEGVPCTVNSVEQLNQPTFDLIDRRYECDIAGIDNDCYDETTYTKALCCKEKHVSEKNFYNKTVYKITAVLNNSRQYTTITTKSYVQLGPYEHCYQDVFGNTTQLILTACVLGLLILLSSCLLIFLCKSV